MQFWGDIILHYPQLIGELPKDSIAMVWGYEGNHPFSSECRKFAASGIPFYVCPGVSSWGSISGRTDNAMANMRNAAVNGLANGTIGYLNTDWGDDGHWQPLPVSYPGYAYGAAVSWALESNRDIDIVRALDLFVFRDKAGVMGRLVYDLGNTYKQTGAPTANGNVLFYLLQNPEASFSQYPCANLKIDNMKKTQDYIDKVMLPLSKARMDRPDAQEVADEMANAAAMLRHSCSLAIVRLQAKDTKISSIPKDTCEKLAGELKKIIAEYKRLWLLRNLEGGLSDSVGRLEKVLELYQTD
jgi:hexosaminidase